MNRGAKRRLSSMSTLRTKLCILGGGPAALLCGRFLLDRGIDVITIAASRHGMLSPIEIDGIRFSAVPIFVDPESGLFSRLNWEGDAPQDLLKVEYVGTSESGRRKTPTPGSVAEFLTRLHDDPTRAIVLARKHMGQTIDEEDIPELREKIRRHYIMKPQRQKRLGFHEGLSPYLHYLLKRPEVAIIYDTVEKIDVANKYVAGRLNTVHFERLISTIPLDQFLALSNFNTGLATESGGAHFALFRTDEDIEINRLIYDCNPMSETYRLFVPVRGIIIAHSARQHWYASRTSVARRVQTLLGLTEVPMWKSCLTLPKCYPLEVSDYALKECIRRELETQGILLFGRFGEWEYRDLDELDWGRCDEFVAH